MSKMEPEEPDIAVVRCAWSLDSNPRFDVCHRLMTYTAAMVWPWIPLQPSSDVYRVQDSLYDSYQEDDDDDRMTFTS
jgi:hypothetical protein